MGFGSQLDNPVHLAHNVRLGTACLRAAESATLLARRRPELMRRLGERSSPAEERSEEES